MADWKEPWQPVLAASNGFVQQTVAGASASLTVPAGATGATINVEADAADLGSSRVLRYRDDGGVPTSSVGALAGDGAQINLINQSQLQNFRAIRVTGNSVILNIQYFYNTLST